jgi:hypothetical protein
MEVGKINVHQSIVAVLQSKRPQKIFSSVALQHGHTIIIYFTCWNEVPGAIVCPRPEQLVRSTPFQP